MKGVPKTNYIPIALLSLWFASSCTQAPGELDVGVVNLSGHNIRVLMTGIHNVERDEPVVVFEMGAGGPIEAWGQVIPDVAQFAPVIAYDRPGNGQSEWDGQKLTLKFAAERLHSVLEKVKAQPPYVLVGYSLGGPFIRMFTGLYPGEVAGLVYVDPTEWPSDEEQRVFYQEMGVSAAELKEVIGKERQSVNENVATIDRPGLRSEMELYLRAGMSKSDEDRFVPRAPGTFSGVEYE